MTVTPLGRDQDCSLKIREPDVPAPWFLDPGGWSKTASVSLYFIFPGICTLSLIVFGGPIIIPVHLVGVISSSSSRPNYVITYSFLAFFQLFQQSDSCYS
ncbi:hypothetical protein STEG23_024279 [Scotinomys teguina]